MQNIIVQNLRKCPQLPWMVEFHSTADGTILNNQLKSAFAGTYLDHLSLLNPQSESNKHRLTQIICAIPPVATPLGITALLEAGMTVALIKLFRITPQEAEMVVKMLNETCKDYSKEIGRAYPLAIAFDVTEPDIFIGKLKEPHEKIELKKGSVVKITSSTDQFKNVSSEHKIVVNQDFSTFVKSGDDIVLGDNDLILSVIESAENLIKAVVRETGIIVDFMEVSLPESVTVLPSKIIKRDDVKLAQKLGVNFVLVGESLLQQAKTLLDRSPILIITKIENAQNFDQLDETILNSDAILIDPGYIEMDMEEHVFLIEKAIIAKCSQAGKPTIVAVDYKTITKSQTAEISDVIVKGIDALLIPPTDLNNVTTICRNAEATIYHRRFFDELSNVKLPPVEPLHALSIAAAEASLKTNAAAIIAMTLSGRCARSLSIFKPRCPIIALTVHRRVAKSLQIYRGIIPILSPEMDFRENYEQYIKRVVQFGITFGKLSGLIRAGDVLITITGSRPEAGFVNCMRIVFASEYNTLDSW